MTLFAREDIQSIAVPTGVGGCGNTHRRPKKAGIPVKVWGISCPGCESTLGADPAWSRDRFQLPKSPDQALEDERALQRAEAAEAQARVALARQQMDQMRLTQPLTPLIEDDDIAITGDEVDGVGDASSPQTDRPTLVDAARGNYKAMTVPDLKDLARERGLPVSGTKTDLVDRHAEHEVDNPE